MNELLTRYYAFMIAPTIFSLRVMDFGSIIRIITMKRHNVEQEIDQEKSKYVFIN